MRVLVIGALAVLTLAVLIGVLIYDRKVLAKKKLIIQHLFRMATQLNADEPCGIPIRKIALMECVDVDAIKFATLATALSKSGIINREQDSISLTDYGLQYYEFKIKPDFIVRA